MRSGILHSLVYDQKSEWVKAADTLLTLPRLAFGGKVVDCYNIDHKKALFYESRPVKQDPPTIALRVAAGAASIFASPLLLVALGVKYTNDKNDKVLTRYQERLKNDKFYFRPRIGNDLVSRLAVRLFMKTMGLDRLTASMQIQGDKILKAFNPGQYDGGLGLPVADILLEKIQPYSKDKSDFSTACLTATQALSSYQKISKKMIPLMISRFFPIKWLFHPDQYSRDLAKDLKDQLKRLKKRQVIMIPLTFYSSTRGYRTVVNSFTRIGKDNYDWKIYRPDIGSEGKMSFSFLPKKNRIPGIRLKNLTAKQVRNVNFLKSIIDFGSIARYGQGEQFFQFIKDYRKEHHNVKFSSHIAYSRALKADVFTMRGLNFALKDLMGKEHYNHYKLLMRIDNLIELNEAIESQAISNPESLGDAKQLFELAKEDMNRRLQNMQKYLGIGDPSEVLNENQRKFLQI